MRSRRSTSTSGRVLAAFESLAAVGLLVMMMVTVVDVGGRYVFNTPLRAGFELTRVPDGAARLPRAAARVVGSSHVRITLIDGVLGPRAIRLRDGAVGVVSGAVCLMLAWPLARLAALMGGYGDGTQTLGLPLAPLAWVMVTSLVVSALVLIDPAVRPTIVAERCRRDRVPAALRGSVRRAADRVRSLSGRVLGLGDLAGRSGCARNDRTGHLRHGAQLQPGDACRCSF